MDSTDRILGKLEAHHESVTKSLSEMSLRISMMESEIRELQRFKWKVLGACSLVVFVVSKVKF